MIFFSEIIPLLTYETANCHPIQPRPKPALIALNVPNGKDETSDAGDASVSSSAKPVRAAAKIASKSPAAASSSAPMDVTPAPAPEKRKRGRPPNPKPVAQAAAAASSAAPSAPVNKKAKAASAEPSSPRKPAALGDVHLAPPFQVKQKLTPADRVVADDDESGDESSEIDD